MHTISHTAYIVITMIGFVLNAVGCLGAALDTSHSQYKTQLCLFVWLIGTVLLTAPLMVGYFAHL